MAQNVLVPPAVAEDAAAREAKEMMAEWDQVGPWYSRGLFWLALLLVSTVVVIFIVESLAAGV